MNTRFAHKKKREWWTVIGIIILGMTASNAVAEITSDSQPASGLEEITVTARRRSENLQDTPIAVTALSAKELEETSSRNIADIARLVPNVVFNPAGGASGASFVSNIYIRGIGQNEYLPTTDPGVGIYVDGVYFGRATGSVFDLVDVSQVEVLRGPQGTLFGKNTIGGVINVTTTRPTDTLTGEVQATGGSDGRADFQALVSGPLMGDRLLGKLAVASKNYDGYGTQADGIRTSDESAVLGRAELLFKATDDLTISFAVDGEHRRQHSAAQSIVYLITTPGKTGVAGLWNAFVGSQLGEAYDQRFVIGAMPAPGGGAYYATGNLLTSDTGGPHYSNLDKSGFGATIDWSVSDALKFKSITAYRQVDAQYSHENCACTLGLASEYTDDTQHQLSQEFQLAGVSLGDRLHWTTGVFGFYEQPRYLDTNAGTPGLYAATQFIPGFGGGIDTNFLVFDKLKTTSFAVYGQGSYKLTDALSATAGVRFTDEEKKLETAQFERIAMTYSVPPTELNKTWTKISPRLGFEYKIVPDVLAYVSASEGFKSGGFNGRAQTTAGVQPFDPESVWTYEAGLKSEYLDHRVRLNAAVFYNDYKDLQVSASVPSATPGVLAAVIANAARATIKGVELEAQARPANDWLFSASVGYQPSKYNHIDPTVTSISESDHLVKTPLWNGSAAASYTLPFREFGEFRIRADYSFTSKQYFSAKNTSYLSAVNPDGSADTQTRGIADAVSQHAYGLINARLIWEEQAAHLSAAAYVTNLANKVYLANAFDLTQGFGNVLGFPGAPRQWGVALKYKF